MNTAILKHAGDRKFTDFSNAVKSELKNKLANREEIKTYISDFDRVQQMKSMFAQINTEFGSDDQE